MAFRLWFLSCLFILIDSKLLQAKSIRLEAGESYRLAVESGVQLDLSPKGIIDIDVSGKAEITLFGLKSGVAVLRLLRGEKVEKIFIEVLKRDSSDEWLRRKEWQSYFCLGRGIQCDFEQSRIFGVSDDIDWFYKARKQCRDKMPCTWAVELSSRAIQNFKQNYQALYPDWLWSLSSDGSIAYESDCSDADEKLAKAAAESFKTKYEQVPERRCRRSSVEVWKAEVIVWAEKKGKGDKSNPIRWDKLEWPQDKPLKAIISELAEEHHYRILAAPTLLLSLGANAFVKDGQEFQTLAVQKDSEELLWKSTGFRLDLKLLERQNSSFRILLKMGLSQAQNGGQSLDASEFASELWLAESKFVRIGKLDAELKTDEETRIPWLSSIPLLGELFRWRGEGRAKSEVEIIMKLSPQALEEGATSLNLPQI